MFVVHTSCRPALLVRRGVWLDRVRVGRTEKRREHALQTADQKIRFPAALGKLLDLRILGDGFFVKECDFPLQTRNIFLRQVGTCRDLSRLAGNCRSRLSLGFIWFFMRDIGRDRSRLVMACRWLVWNDVVGLGVWDIECDWSRHVAARRACDFLNLRDVPRDRRRCNEIFFAEGGFLPKAIKMTLCTISLDASNGARVASVFIAKAGLFDRQGIVVGAGRGLSRQVVVHISKSNPPWRLRWAVIHNAMSGLVAMGRGVLLHMQIHAPA